MNGLLATGSFQQAEQAHTDDGIAPHKLARTSRLAYPVPRKMEERYLLIPYNPHIRAELCSMTKQTTRAGNMRFTTERNKNIQADRF